MQYTFKNRRDLVATKDFSSIDYFAEPTGLVRIDSENIVELVEN